MQIEEITLKLTDGQWISGTFSEHGWQQWGAPESVLSETVQFWDALIVQAQEDDELATLLGIREADPTDLIWDQMNESERHGVRFGLFPAWVGRDYPDADLVALMERAARV